MTTSTITLDSILSTPIDSIVSDKQLDLIISIEEEIEKKELTPINLLDSLIKIEFNDYNIVAYYKSITQWIWSRSLRRQITLPYSIIPSSL